MVRAPDDIRIKAGVILGWLRRVGLTEAEYTPSRKPEFLRQIGEIADDMQLDDATYRKVEREVFRELRERRRYL